MASKWKTIYFASNLIDIKNDNLAHFVEGWLREKVLLLHELYREGII